MPETIATRSVHSRSPLFSWGAVFAGLFISILSFSILMSLGMAVGGLALDNLMANFGSLSIGAGIWLIVSALLSLFVGSYYGARISNFVTSAVGTTHGLVVSALFFALLLFNVGVSLGVFGRAVGTTISGVGAAVGNVAETDIFQQTVQDIVQGLDMTEDEVGVVIRGVAMRLLQGDFEGAQQYLSSQTGISQQEAADRVAQAQMRLENIAQEAGERASQAVSTAGWILFAMITLGAVFAGLGGAIGARSNRRKPMGAKEIITEEQMQRVS